MKETSLRYLAKNPINYVFGVAIAERCFDTMLGEEQGRITGVRMLPGGKWEVSFQASGRLLGVEANNMGTYEAMARPNGTLFEQGQVVIMTKDGKVVSWVGHGVGRLTGRGMAVSWRASICCETASHRLARLNSAVTVLEFEADENGNTSTKAWEWK